MTNTTDVALKKHKSTFNVMLKNCKTIILQPDFILIFL